jgi:hypothetical protein
MPFTIIWGLLTSRLAGHIGSAAAIALAIALGVVSIKAAVTEGALRDQNKTLTASLNLANLNLQTCKGNEASLSAAIDRQNVSMKALSDRSAADTAKASAAVVAARSSASEAARRVAIAKAAKAGPDACASADSLILGSVQ